MDKPFSIDALYDSTLKYTHSCLEQLARNMERIENSEPDLKIDTANLIEVARQHPAIYAYYRGMYNVCRGAIKRCQTYLDLLVGELYDTYRNSYDIKLSSQEIKYYITHDSRYREILDIQTIFESKMYQIEGICDSLVAKGYSINNIVKLRSIQAEQERYER